MRIERPSHLTLAQPTLILDQVERLAEAVATQAHGSRLLWVSVASAPEGPPGRTLVVRALHVCPTARMWALPGWRATVEGVQEHQGFTLIWTSHEVEKGLRYLLRQSHGLLEWLAAPRLPYREQGQLAIWRQALEELAPLALHRGAVETYCAMARGYGQADDPQARWAAVRHGLTGLCLTQTGQLITQPEHLLIWATSTADLPTWVHDPERWGVVDRSALERLLAGCEGPGLLPAQAPGYHAFSRYLVRLRLAALAGGW